MNEYYPFINTPLPYLYDALEPFIDQKTMQLHHDKHLQTYIDNLNAILKDNPRLQKYSLTELIYYVPKLPKALQVPVRNNAGGVYNHRFYFDNLTPQKDEFPQGALGTAIHMQFESFEKFQELFKEAALSVFGSGYAWLVLDGRKLRIITTPNQNNPIEQGLCPVLSIDVWEHAYYLKHYNVRSAYIDDWFHVVNWENAERNYINCIE